MQSITRAQHSTYRRTAVSAVGVIAGLLLLSCGGSGDGARKPAKLNGSQATSADAEDRAPSPGATTSADAKSLRAADYVITEVPTSTGLVRMNFPGSPGEVPRKDVQGLADAFEKCLGTPYDVVYEEAYNGPVFTDSDAVSPMVVNSFAGILPAGKVDEETAALRHPRYAECTGDLAAERVLAGVRAGAGANAELSIDTEVARFISPSAGATAAMEIVMNVTGPAGQVKLHTVSVMVLRGQVEAGVAVQRSGGPPDQALIDLMSEQLVRNVGA